MNFKDLIDSVGLQGVEVVQVSINGVVEGLYTKEAYQELRLQMSTGDFHVHKTKKVYVHDFNAVITTQDME